MSHYLMPHKTKGDCCAGEPFRGDPNGLHSDDCPVYIANMEAMERAKARRFPPAPCREQQPHGLHSHMGDLGRWYCCVGVEK